MFLEDFIKFVLREKGTNTPDTKLGDQGPPVWASAGFLTSLGSSVLTCKASQLDQLRNFAVLKLSVSPFKRSFTKENIYRIVKQGAAIWLLTGEMSLGFMH